MDSAAKPIVDGRSMHLKLAPQSVAPHVIVVGAAGRSRAIAEEFLQDVEQVGGDDDRYYLVYTGTFMGVRITIATHGLAAGSMDMALDELMWAGGRRFIRVGSCSTIQENIDIAGSAILQGGVRLDGASDDRVMPQYPAVADFRIVSALVDAAVQQKYKHYVGIGATTATFGLGQARPRADGYIPERILQRDRELVANRVLIYEMEATAMMVFCSTQDLWCGAVMAIYGNRPKNQLEIHAGDEQSRHMALLALVRLAQQYPLP